MSPENDPFVAQPPRADVAVPDLTDPTGSRLTRAAFYVAIAPLVGFVSCVAATTSERDSNLPYLVVGLLGMAGGVVGTVVGLVALVRAIRRGGVRPALLAVLANAGLVAATYFWGLEHLRITRGRQLLRGGRPRLPGARHDRRWSSERPDRIDAPPGAAEAWRANAATETASVAAFAELSLQLLAQGAPPELVRDAHADALDEIRHAELCYGLAAALDGTELGPAPFHAAAEARGRLDLPTLAVEALVHGAYLESVSAEVARALATCTAIPAIREILETIAADEARHAAHGWDVVDFCLERGGLPVERALEAAAARLPAQTSGAALLGHDGALEPFGIAGRELIRRSESSVRATCLATLRARGQRFARAA